MKNLKLMMLLALVGVVAGCNPPRAQDKVEPEVTDAVTEEGVTGTDEVSIELVEEAA